MRGLQYKRERKKVGGNGNNQYLKLELVQNEPIPIETANNTAERLGEQHKVSSSTIKSKKTKEGLSQTSDT